MEQIEEGGNAPPRQVKTVFDRFVYVLNSFQLKLDNPFEIYRGRNRQTKTYKLVIIPILKMVDPSLKWLIPLSNG